ncbi:ATP-binding cassette domain-containing protein [Actinoplanes sp. NBC_00393]|uniref:ATP-binding cassette domain-containing protein n=1 Tax=Actinoplanes sp. NBC_00393 TaxID=2975953 RepID=UPI002E20AC13
MFHNLDIELNGGVTALLGPNGSGKTTLLRTLATVQPPRGGRLLIEGQEVRSESIARALRRRISYLPQRFGFEPGMRVRDFVRYGAWLRDLPPGDWADATAAALQHVGLTDESGVRMGRLSGGMRQRAAIAWAIVGRPGLVLLDEPTVGLDTQQRLRFRDTVANMPASTVLLSTHLIDDVDAICERVVVMHTGGIRFTGTTDELRALDDASMPGHTPLERAYMSLLPVQERRR